MDENRVTAVQHHGAITIASNHSAMIRFDIYRGERANMCVHVRARVNQREREKRLEPAARARPSDSQPTRKQV